MFNEETVKKEFEALKNETVKEIKLNNDWSEPYFEIETEEIKNEYGHMETREYMVCENEEKAESIAISQVKQDLEDDPELFNQDWLNCLKKHKLKNQSFIEYASEDAVNVDGFEHFLARYDGQSDTTESGFVVMRTN